MEFRHLNFFLALCETRHFGRAAQQLGTTQPNLTRQVRALEQELGAPLFLRDRRRVEISDAGRTLEPLARRVQLLEGQIRHAVSRGVRRAPVVVAHVPAALTTVVPPALRSLKQVFPESEPQLVERFPPGVAAAVRSGEASLGFGVECSEGLASYRIVSIPYAVVLSRTHRLAQRRGPIRLAQLAGERWVTIPDDCRPRPHCRVLARMEELGFGGPSRVPSATHQGILALVGAGVGFALLPGTVARMRFPGVVFKRSADALPTQDVSLLWREDEDSPEILGLIESVRVASRVRPEKLQKPVNP